MHFLDFRKLQELLIFVCFPIFTSINVAYHHINNQKSDPLTLFDFSVYISSLLVYAELCINDCGRARSPSYTSKVTAIQFIWINCILLNIVLQIVFCYQSIYWLIPKVLLETAFVLASYQEIYNTSLCSRVFEDNKE